MPATLTLLLPTRYTTVEIALEPEYLAGSLALVLQQLGTCVFLTDEISHLAQAQEIEALWANAGRILAPCPRLDSFCVC